MTTLETRVYPVGCTSAYCGRLKCDGCPRLPELQAFQAWKAERAAECKDPIWCPTVYTATK